MRRKAIYNPQYREMIAYIGDMRKKQGLTQSALGKRMRLSRQTIQKIETCEVRLDLVRYVNLCRILGIDAGQLLGRLEDQSEEDDPLFICRTAAGDGVGRVSFAAEFYRSKIFVRLFVRHLVETRINIG